MQPCGKHVCNKRGGALGYLKKSTVLLCTVRLLEERGLLSYTAHSNRDCQTGTRSKKEDKSPKGDYSGAVLTPSEWGGTQSAKTMEMRTYCLPANKAAPIYSPLNTQSGLTDTGERWEDWETGERRKAFMNFMSCK